MQVNKHVFQYLPTMCAQNYTHTHIYRERERVLQDQICYRLREKLVKMVQSEVADNECTNKFKTLDWIFTKCCKGPLTV